MDNISLRQLEARLWASADNLRANSKLTSNQYCMPILGLIFLRYAFSRFQLVAKELMKERPVRRGRVMPLEASEFRAKSALYLPEAARYDYIVKLPEDIPSQHLTGHDGKPLNTLGEVINNAMVLIEGQSKQLEGILPKNYTIFEEELLRELIRIFNDAALNEVGGDIIGRIYEYFLNKFAKDVAQDDGVFFTPKSLVKMIVNVIEPERGILLDPACGSGGMFVQTGDFVNGAGMAANHTMTFYGQEKVEYNAQLCLMNMAVHGLTGNIKSGNEANTFYNDAHHLAGKCDYVMANPPFNVDKVKADKTKEAGRLPFGLPGVNKDGDVSNANYLWISYFYAYLNEHGRAGFVMASSATDSQNKDKEIRKKLIQTGHVDVIISVANNFFYTLSLPCTLWFFNKAKTEACANKVLFIDARNYYTVVDRNLNEWNDWQLKNLTAIVWLYRGKKEAYTKLLAAYRKAITAELAEVKAEVQTFWQTSAGYAFIGSKDKEKLENQLDELQQLHDQAKTLPELYVLVPAYEKLNKLVSATVKGILDDMKALKGKAKRDYIDQLTTPKKVKVNEFKKALTARVENVEHVIAPAQVTLTEAQWLTDKFADGTYADIAGLCSVNTVEDIEEKDYSLTPGAYVGVPEAKDDGVDFATRMKEIHAELLQLQDQSNELMATISKNMKEMGL